MKHSLFLFLVACGPAIGVDDTQSQSALWYGPETLLSITATGTISFHADVSGDGLDDVCSFDPGPVQWNPRGYNSRALRCFVRTRSGLFLQTPRQVPGLEFQMGNGIVSTQRQTADVDADGRVDICGVHLLDGYVCARNNGTGFDPARTWQASVTAANGWQTYGPYGSTMKLIERQRVVSGLIGRGMAGILYWEKSGQTFAAQPTQTLTDYSDANGWYQASHYETIMVDDINGDGADDLCARGNDGILCNTFNAQTGRFGSTVLWTTQFSNASGWRDMRAETLRLADVDRDGKADVCGLGSAGLYCGYSNGTNFADAQLLRADGLAFWETETAFSSCAVDESGTVAISTDLLLEDVTLDGRPDACVVRVRPPAGATRLPMTRVAASVEVWCAEGLAGRQFASFRVAARRGNMMLGCEHELGDAPLGRWDGWLSAPFFETWRRPLCLLDMSLCTEARSVIQ